MNAIIAPFRRRFSSNTSSNNEYEPSSPGADARRPTISDPMNLRILGPFNPYLGPGFETAYPISYYPSAADSVYMMASEYQDDDTDDQDFSRPFTTMGRILQEEGFPPLERQTDGDLTYINDVGGFSGPVLPHYGEDVLVSERYVGEVSSVIDIREKPMRKMSRRVSTVGKRARRLSDMLGRRASKLLRMNMAPNIIRSKDRDGFNLEEEWHAAPHVDLGREVEEDDDQWRRDMEQNFQNFRVIEWTRQ